MIEVRLSHELYQAAENMYVSLDLATVVRDLVLSLESSFHRRLLSNIILTGGVSLMIYHLEQSPTSITALTSLPSFKRQLKTFLFTKSFPSV